MTGCAPTRSKYSVEVASPLDAEGKPIPIHMTLLYDRTGAGVTVNEFKLKINTVTGAYSWVAVGFREGGAIWSTFLPESLFITRPDSIKQLAEDLNRVQNAYDGDRISVDVPCHYDKNRGKYCNGCRLNSHGKINCLDAMMADIVSRVNRLAGDSE